MKRAIIQTAALLQVIALAAGCSQARQPEQARQASPADAAPKNALTEGKPVTIKIYTGSSDEDYRRNIEEPIKGKYPNVTLVRQNQQKNKLTDLVTAGQTPDIIQVTPNVFASDILELGLQYDLNELIKKYKYDMGRFIPELTDSIRSYGGQGQTYAIPVQSTLYGLLYNKEVFDRFAVPYPKDNMTWEQTIELARKLTRTDNGIQYRGLDVQGYLQLSTQLSLNLITKEDKAVLSTPPWQSVSNVYKQIYDIEGNNRELSPGIGNLYQPFIEGKVGMLAISLIRMISQAQDYPDLKWDVVTFPTFAEAPGKDPQVNYVMSMISSTSSLKDEAFELMTYLVSDEVQKRFVAQGFVTPLKNPDIQKLIGKNIPSLNSKNLAAAYKNKQTDVIFSKYQTSRVNAALDAAFNKIRTGQADINTALREAEEKTNQEIEAQKKR